MLKSQMKCTDWNSVKLAVEIVYAVRTACVLVLYLQPAQS